MYKKYLEVCLWMGIWVRMRFVDKKEARILTQQMLEDKNFREEAIKLLGKVKHFPLTKKSYSANINNLSLLEAHICTRYNNISQ